MTHNPIAGARPTILTRVPYRGWESHIALPMQHDLDSLGPHMLPYAFVPFSSVDMLGTTVGIGQTVYGAITQDEDCWITHLVGSCINPASPATTGTFTVQFYDTQRAKLFPNQPFTFGSILGTAQKPFFLRRLYALPSAGELKCSVVNLSSFAAEIQVVAWGLRRDVWKAVSKQ